MREAANSTYPGELARETTPRTVECTLPMSSGDRRYRIHPNSRIGRVSLPVANLEPLLGRLRVADSPTEQLANGALVRDPFGNGVLLSYVDQG